jgi:hypothetical protein
MYRLDPNSLCLRVVIFSAGMRLSVLVYRFTGQISISKNNQGKGDDGGSDQRNRDKPGMR